VFNFQRGRENIINFWKDGVDQWNGFIPTMIKDIDCSNVIGNIEIHRGFLFLVQFLSFANTTCYEAKRKLIPFDIFCYLTNAKFISYRSKNLIMDSVIFSIPAEQIKGFRCLPFKKYNNQDVKRKIAAAKAIRTMRSAA
jgi:hypothetical protein